MLPISTYQDLTKEIDIYRKRLEDLEREQYALIRLRHNNGMEYNRYLEKQCELNNKVAIIQAIVDDKKETKTEIIKRLKELDGLEHRIAYKRFVEGKQLDQIAKELGYSDSYVMKKSAKVTKIIKEWRKSEVYFNLDVLLWYYENSVSDNWKGFTEKPTLDSPLVGFIVEIYIRNTQLK